MPKPKKTPKTGNFEKASRSAGIPFGWSEVSDDPSMPSKPKLPKVIHHDNSVKDTDGYITNVKAMIALGSAARKLGGVVTAFPNMTKAEADLEKKNKKANNKKKGKVNNDE